MRKILPFFFILIAILFVSVIVGWKYASSPVNSNDNKSQDFLIIKGQGVGEIAQKLEVQGFIKNKIAFRVYVQTKGMDKKIQAGEYRLSPDMSLQQIVLVLISGPKEIWVTYPEGLRREEIAVRTIKTLGIEGSLANDFMQEFLKSSDGEEGFLSPDTYLFSKDVKAETVAKKLRSTFDAKISGRMLEDIRKSSLTVQEIVTLASIIERETNTNDERPIVAGILLKRIQKGWPLQVDATLQYLIATRRCKTNLMECEWWKPPTVQDKKVSSGYNTYQNFGLPPGPIANPSLSSIEAVVYSKDSLYWFYLHGSGGKIHYAETIEEHNENIRKYIQ